MIESTIKYMLYTLLLGVILGGTAIYLFAKAPTYTGMRVKDVVVIKQLLNDTKKIIDYDEKIVNIYADSVEALNIALKECRGK